MEELIRIENLCKAFGTQNVLTNINISFPNKGMVAIVGQSGSGKSTLLNLISALDDDYSGKIYFKNKSIKTYSDNEKEYYRLTSMGYVFQNFMLMDLENVINNVIFPLDVVSNISTYEKERRAKDLLRLVNLSEKTTQKINTLSGGERQRVAIARALINNPEFLLCDEPTGSLDETNSKEVMELLKIISQKTLVIIVSHDIELIRKYADKIIHIENGYITNREELINRSSEKKLNIFSFKYSNKKPSISLKFIFSHLKAIIDSKKARTLITTFVTSLGLLGVGASLLLSSSISKEIKNAFSSVVDANKIVMKNSYSDKNLYGNVFSASLNEINNISNKYSDYVSSLGIYYQANFESYFYHYNEIYVSSFGSKYYLDNLSARNINEYEQLSFIDKSIYPSRPVIMEKEQVVIGMNYKTMFNLCFALKITRSFESLGEYILENDLTMSLYVANFNWQYEDEQIFTVVGVYESVENTFAHIDTNWNEVVFEEKMRLPTTDNMLVKEYPWTLPKAYYLYVKNPNEFLDKTLLDKDYKEYIFERSSLLREDIDKVVVYHIEKECIDINDVNEIFRANSRLKSYLITNDLGYTMYSSSLTMGFTNNFYLSDKADTLDEILSYEILNKNKSIGIPDNVIVGSAIKSAQGGLTFSSNLTKEMLEKGELPKNVNEIVVSSSIYDKFDLILGEKIKAGTITYYNESSPIDSEYKIVDIKIVGVVKNKSPVIYHNNLWTISFFRDKLGISMFNLLPRNIVIEIDKDNIEKEITYLSKNYPNYSFSSPSKEVSDSIDETLDYVIFILLIFSSFSLIISVLLLITTTHLTISENTKDITLFKYLGISDSNIVKMYTFLSLLMGLIGYLVTAVELFIFNIVFKITLSKMFYSPLNFSIDIYPFLITLGLISVTSIIVGLLVSLIWAKKKR